MAQVAGEKVVIETVFVVKEIEVLIKKNYSESVWSNEMIKDIFQIV